MITDWDNLEDETPLFWSLDPAAQTGGGRGLKFSMEVHLRTTAGVTFAIFEFPPPSRDIGDFPPPGSAPLTPYISAQGWKFKKRKGDTTSTE